MFWMQWGGGGAIKGGCHCFLVGRCGVGFFFAEWLSTQACLIKHESTAVL